MKISLKQILAVSALAVASTSAFADIVAPSTGTTANNGELALYVMDTVTNQSYARGLQLDMNSILSQSAVQADVSGGTYTVGEAVNFSVGTIAPDANLTAFLAQAQAAGHAVVWTVAGGVAVNANTAGAARYAVALTDDLSAGTEVTNSLLRTSFATMNTTVSDSNLNIPGTVLHDGGSTNTGISGYNSGSTNLAGDVYGTGIHAQVDLGTAANFYLLSTAGGTAPDSALVYTLNALTLSSNGTLSSAGGSTVTPIPAAIWLLGSGLAGLVGIGRRKNASVSA